MATPETRVLLVGAFDDALHAHAGLRRRALERLGCRVEYWFRPLPPRNGGEAAAAVDPDLERYMHLAALNRGILLTPFHNMALLAPAVTQADVDRHTEVFRESVQAGGLYR